MHGGQSWWQVCAALLQAATRFRPFASMCRKRVPPAFRRFDWRSSAKAALSHLAGCCCSPGSRALPVSLLVVTR